MFSSMEKIVNVTCKEKVKRHLKDNTVQVSLINLPVCKVISNNNWNFIYIYKIPYIWNKKFTESIIDVGRE